MVPRSTVARLIAFAATLATAAAVAAGSGAAPRLSPVDESDRVAFQSWFTLLADAQFERSTGDVTDCASLVRHAYREALRAHTPEWHRRAQLPATASFPDVRGAPTATGHAWRLFRVASEPDRFSEFADAATLIRFNAHSLGRDTNALQTGDLLYFRQDQAKSPDHLMIFVGPSRFDPSRADWIVYHTGPQDGHEGEMRKTSLADLTHHPSARWRPVRSNPAFVGVFRLSLLDRSR
ncbi:MAG: DUF1175 family protein [Acidobacteriota bacterium]